MHSTHVAYTAPLSLIQHRYLFPPSPSRERVASGRRRAPVGGRPTHIPLPDHGGAPPRHRHLEEGRQDIKWIRGERRIKAGY